jgi:hypothetical protein
MTMSEEGFLRRWARRKTETKAGIEPAPEPASEIVLESSIARVPVAEAAPAPVQPMPVQPTPVQPTPVQPIVLPTMDDVAQLTPESDFSAFVARGVDQAVRRSALKKLFADPHFNVMDKLDMYMDDYNVASPMPAEMLASLKHSKSFFDQAAEDARKRAEAEARAEAGRVMQASLPCPAEPGAAGAAHALPPEDAGEAADEVADEAAEPAEVLEVPPMPAGAHTVAETGIMMQKQP